MSNLVVKQQADRLRGFLAAPAVKEQIIAALPPAVRGRISPERMARVVMTAAQSNPRLLECDPTSILKGVLQAAALGLEPDGLLGQAYLVPRKGQASLEVGYRGLILLARQSGEIRDLSAEVVRENDFFEWSLGLNRDLKHVPAEGERGEITYAYAATHFTNGGYAFEVMSKAEIDAIRDKSPGKNAGPWRDHYSEMARKTAIRRLSKYLPLSVQQAAAVGTETSAGTIQINPERETVLQPSDEVQDLGEGIIKQPEPGGQDRLDAFAEAGQ